jgi:CcmD family protein
MFDEGKMYVVVGVLLIILIGLFVYVFSIDRKLSRMEKKLRHKNTEGIDNY